jgi:hypothetical protein
MAALAITMASVSPSLASETTGGVSVGNANSDTLNSFLKNTHVTFFSTVHGTPLNDVTSPYTLDHNGNKTKSPANAIYFDSEVAGSYVLNSDIGLGVVVPFLFIPVQGQGAILGDVGIKTFNKHLISGGGFNLSANLILQAPTAKASRNRDMDFGVKSTPAIRYAIPSSRFTVGSWNEAKWYAGVAAGKTLKLYAQPYVEYSLSQSFSLNVGYEMETDHMKGDSNLNFTTYQTDLMPGVIWRVTPQVSFNPYLQIFTGKKVATDATAFGAVINAAIL